MFVQNLMGLMIDAINNYYVMNGNRFPETIIVYRDGVGESQIDSILENEITKVLDSF